MKCCPVTHSGKTLKACIFILIAIVPSFSTATEQNIHALRSAYLYYFSYFIEWPEDTVFLKSKLQLCALTKNIEDRFQLSTIDNKALRGRRLNIHILDQLSGTNIAKCHMLFVGSDITELHIENLPRLPENVLLITEGSLPVRGSIHLYTKNNKLKFEIDNETLNAKNFKASSKLLRLSQKEASEG